MKRKNLVRLLTATMAFILMFCCIAPAQAVVDLPPSFDDTATQRLGTSTAYPNGVFARLTVADCADRRHTFSNTTVNHRAGISVTITAPRERVTVNATGDLGCNAVSVLGSDVAHIANNAFSGDLSVQLDIAESVTFYPSSTITFTISADAPAGRYCTAYVFPGKTATKQVYGITSGNVQKTLWTEIVTYAPLIDEAYIDVVYLGS